LDWPGLRPLISVSAPDLEHLAAVTNIAWQDASPYSPDEEGLDELPRSAIRRRVVLRELATGVTVYARYTDGAAAIVSKQIGDGHLMVLTTSPDPVWSDLGVRAAGLITWLHRLVEEATGPASAVATFQAGERTRHRFGSLPAEGLARVSSTSDPSARSSWIRIVDGAPQEDWPTDFPGLYSVRTAGHGSPPSLYAVNWPAEESDLTQITLPQLKARLGCEQVTLEAAARLGQKAERGLLAGLLANRDPMLAVPLLLVLLFLTELVLAQRTHQPGAATSAPNPNK
jgi:hypothetical protein